MTYTYLHGVFLKINHSGVLLTGEPGVGKSRTALSLIDRGHQLIADDIVECWLEQQKILGQAPRTLQNLLKIRGAEILNIQHLYGDAATCKQHSLDLIIHLKNTTTVDETTFDTLTGNYENKPVFNQTVTQINLMIQPGMESGLLVEAIVKNHVNKLTNLSTKELELCA